MAAVGLDAPRLMSLLAEGIERASRRRRRTLVSATVELDEVDPAAVAFASRRASDHWFCWQQPDRDLALASLGSALRVVSSGPDRFTEVADRCGDLSGDAIVLGAGHAGPGVGPVWTGGFAFADEARPGTAWSSFEPAAMTMPELSLISRQGRAHLSANVIAGPGMDSERALAGAERRVAGLVDEELPMIDPHPTERPRIESARPPGSFEEAVSEAVRIIGAGSLEKVVLAREVVVRAGSAHDPAAIFGALRQGFPSCFCFCAGTPEAAFLGASPELLLRREGQLVATVGLAGSTRRSADPAVDDHLAERLMSSEKDRGEQEVVVRRIVKALSRLSVWVEAAPEPEIVKVANIQHLGTPVIAQLSRSRSAVELAGLLHPTPAVGGEPWPRAGSVLAGLERMDRGWYSGPVGWMDAAEDGEFCVALRSALLRDREAHLFAGVGVVADSRPDDELAETEVKLGALLPLLEG